MKKKLLVFGALIVLSLSVIFLVKNDAFSKMFASINKLFSGSSSVAIDESPLDAFESKSIKVNYYASDMSRETGFAYNDGMFLESSNGLSTDIAKMSVALASSAYQSYNITEVLADMGFTTQRFYNYTDYGSTPKEIADAEGGSVTLFFEDKVATIDDNDFVAFSISNKKITYKGEDYMIYVVPVRGTPGTEEWFSNFKLSEDNDENKNTGNHYGFYTAASQIERCLKGILKNNKNYYDADHTIVLTTGHSRGAAVANIIAGKLTTDSELSQYVNRNRVFGYTYACPAVSKNLEDADTALTNIYNFNSPGDLIPELPKEGWGYKRYGQTKKLDLENNALDIADWENVKQRFYNICGRESESLEETEKMVTLLSGLIVREGDYFSVDNQVIIKMAAYSLAKNKTVTTTEFIKYLSKNGLGEKVAIIIVEKGLDCLTDGQYSEVKEVIDNLINIKKVYTEYKLVINSGLVEELEDEEKFKKWLEDNDDKISEIESQFEVDINSRADLARVLTLTNEKEATTLQAIQVVERFQDLGVSILDIKTVIYDAHTPETYIAWINSMYFGYEGWKNNTSVQISLTSDIKSIGDRCFYECQNLQSVNNADTCVLRYIGNSAFSSLPQLETFDGLNPNLIYIGDSAFVGCSSLNSNSDFGIKAKYIGSDAFYNCKGLTGQLSLSDNMEKLGAYAFFGCSGLTGNVNLGGKLTKIEQSTFYGCSGLEGIEIGETVETIGAYAFKGCTGIKKVKIPISTQYFINDDGGNHYPDAMSFYECNGIEEIEFTRGTGEIYYPKYKDSESTTQGLAYSSHLSLKRVTFEDGIKEIPNQAFEYCSKLETVKLPEGLEKIGNNAFYECSSWNDEIILPSTIKEIGEQVFYNCSKLTGNFVLPEDLETIGSYAFYNCSSLQGDLRIPDNVETIRYCAFFGCSGLTGNVNLGGKLTKIEQSTFYGCSGLEGIEIGETVETIGAYAFKGCTGIKKVKIPISTQYFINDDGGNHYPDAMSFYECNGIEEIEFTRGTGEIYYPKYKDSESTTQGLAYSSHLSLKRVTFEDGIKEIPNQAFEYCSKLETVKLPEGLEKIGNNAFYECSNWNDEVILPSTIKEIGEQVFYNCSKLTGNFVLPEDLETIGSYAFYNCSSLQGDLRIPDNVEMIRYCAFFGCSGLTGNVNLGGKLTKIEQSAFYGCSGLEGIEIGETVETIGAYAFKGCTGIKKVKIPISTQYFINDDGGNHYPDAMSFYECNGIEEIEFTRGTGEIYYPKYKDSESTTQGLAYSSHLSLKRVTFEDGIKEIPNQAFEYCSKLETVKLPEGLEKIGNNAFYECSSWNDEIILPSTIKEIGEQVFYNCSKLTGNFVLPEDLETIGSYAFYNCSSLQGDLRIPDNVEMIRYCAFFGCSGLTGNVNLGGKLTKIEQSTFYGCSGLEGIEIGETVETIGAYAFKGCTGIKKVKIPISTQYFINDDGGNHYPDAMSFYECNGIEEIEFTRGTGEIYYPKYKDSESTTQGLAYSSHLSLKRVTFEDGIKEIPNQAFEYCSKLETVKLPEGLEKIGNNAFYECSSWNDEIILPSTIKEIGEQVFYNCSKLTGNFVLPEDLETIGSYAFYNCSSLQGDLRIPDNVETIRYCAFFGCSGLTGNVNLGGKLTKIEQSAFYGCSGLEGIEIGETVETIGAYAFKGCTGIKKVKIPISTQYFINDDGGNHYPDAMSFYECNGIEEIEFTRGTGEIYYPKYKDSESTTQGLAYSSHLSLKRVTFEDGIKEIPNQVFEYCSKLETVKLPEGLEKIGDNAFYGCSSWNTELKLPDTLKEIGGSAFSGCTNLTVDYNLENISHEHYEFDGWYLDQEFTTKFTGNQTNQTSTIYAHWIPVKYTITFNENGGEELEDDSMQVEYQSNYGELPVCEKEGYKFDGWFTSEDVMVTSDYICDGDMELYAHWTHIHTYKEEIISEATCTENGLKKYTCTLDGESYEEVIEATGHKWDEGKVIKECTCNEDGVTLYTCEKCGVTQEVAVTTEGHKWNETYTVDEEATCSLEGKESIHCKECNAIKEGSQRVIKKLAHNTETITTKATLTIDGSIVKKCKVCGEIVNEEKIYYPKTITLEGTNYTYTGTASKPTVTVKGNDGKTIASSNYTVIYTNNLNVGTASATITFKGNYTGSIVKTFKINAKAISKATITGIKDKTYTGKGLTQSVVVKNGNVVLKNGKDYTVSYKSNKNVGTATVVITGKGDFAGTVTKTFMINPKGVSLKKLTSGKKQFKATWNKNTTQTTGYQIQYSTNKKFNSGNKTIKVKKNKTTSTKAKKLKAKKKYYVRIRTYKTVNGKAYYSDWSKVKNVTTKK